RLANMMDEFHRAIASIGDPCPLARDAIDCIVVVLGHRVGKHKGVDDQCVNVVFLDLLHDGLNHRLRHEKIVPHLCDDDHGHVAATINEQAPSISRGDMRWMIQAAATRRCISSIGSSPFQSQTRVRSWIYSPRSGRPVAWAKASTISKDDL